MTGLKKYFTKLNIKMNKKLETAIRDVEMYIDHECELSNDNFEATLDTLIDVERYIKETSLVCCVIRENEVIESTLFQSFDAIYEIATKFVDEYGLDDNQWAQKDFEETVVEFAKQYIKDA
jgi:hypothetical protein